MVVLAGISAHAATTPLIGFDAPHGGEVYAVGQKQQIQIHGHGFKSLTLELSRDGGTTFESIGTLAITSRTANVFTWTVAGPGTSNAIFRATGSLSKAPYIILSSPFTILNTSANGSAQPVLPDGSVTTPKLADAAVTTPKIADFSVTAAKMNSSASSANFVLAADGAGGAQWVPTTSVLPSGGSLYVLKAGDTIGSNSGPSTTTILGTTNIQGAITNINTIGPLGATVIGNSTSTTTLNGSVTFANPPSIKLPTNYIWVGSGDVQTPYGPGPEGNALTILGGIPKWSTTVGSPVTAATNLIGLQTNINATKNGSPSVTNINTVPAAGGSVNIGNVATGPGSLCSTTILGDNITVGDPSTTTAYLFGLTTNVNSSAAGSPSLTNVNTFPAVGGTVNIGNIAGTITPGQLCTTSILGDSITTGSPKTTVANMVAKTANINSTFDGSTSITNINADPAYDLTRAFGGTVNMGNITSINNVVGVKTNVNSTNQGSPSLTNINTDINSDPTLDPIVLNGATGGIVNIGNITGVNNVVGLKTNVNSTKQASPTTTNLNTDINSDPTLDPIVLNGATGGIVNIGNITGINNVVGLKTNVNSTKQASPTTTNINADINSDPTLDPIVLNGATGGIVNIGNITGFNNVVGKKTYINSTMQASPTTTNINADINSDPTLDPIVGNGATGGTVNMGNITGVNNVVGVTTNINSTLSGSPSTVNINNAPATGGAANMGNITGVNNVVGLTTNINSTLAGSPSTVNINNAPATGGAVNIGNLDPASTAQLLANMIIVGDIAGIATTQADINAATLNINTSSGLSSPTTNISTLSGSTINIGYTDTTKGASTTAISGDVMVTNYTGIVVQNNLQGNSNLDSSTAFMTFQVKDGTARGDISGESTAEHTQDPQFILDTVVAGVDLTIGIVDLALSIAAFADAANPFDTPIALAVGIGAVADSVAAIVDSTAYFVDLALQLAMVGVAYNSNGADYAEWLQRELPVERLYPGDIVGVKNGRISKHTAGAQMLLPISTAPIVVGNVPPLERKPFFNKVGFMGQVPVKVRGNVNAGDFIIPSGLNDGVGIALPPDTITPEQFEMVLGRAWATVHRDAYRVSFVNVAVGLNAKSMSEMLRRSHCEINGLKKEVDALRSNQASQSNTRQLEKELLAIKERLESLERK